MEFDEDGGISNRNWVLSNSRSLVATPLEPPPVLLKADISVSAGPVAEVTIELLFSEDIGSFDAADLGLEQAMRQHYSPDTVSYEADSQTATITYSCLLPGRYKLGGLRERHFRQRKEARWRDGF